MNKIKTIVRRVFAWPVMMLAIILAAPVIWICRGNVKEEIMDCHDIFWSEDED